MDEGFLSLKWNNHKAAFFTILRVLREKRSYTDVTIACDNKFFDVHKIVLMACSEYFSELFEHTQCKNPVIVLKDVASSDLEALLDYMYLGEVDVQQKTLPGLIKAAECLKIKGLAAPDDDGGGGGTAKTRGNTSEFEKPSNKRRRVDRDNDKNSPAPLPPSSRVRRQSQASEGNHISHNLMDKDADLRKDVSQTPLSPGNDERVPHLHCTTEMVTSPQYTGHEDHDTRYGEMPPPPQDNYHDPNHTNRTEDMSPGAEAFQPIMEIKTEQSEVELENGTLKHESSEGHEDPQQHHKDSGGVSDLSHFLTAAMEEAVVPPHLFSGVQQAGPSGMHRQGMPEEGNYGTEDPRAVGMYPPHLLGGEAAHEAQPGQGLPLGETRGMFRCMYCPRIDQYESKWRRHLRIHTGEKPYACSQCGFRANTKHSVIRHERMRHGTGLMMSDSSNRVEQVFDITGRGAVEGNSSGVEESIRTSGGASEDGGAVAVTTGEPVESAENVLPVQNTQENTFTEEQFYSQSHLPSSL